MKKLIFFLLIPFFSNAQMIKNLPTSTVVDSFTYFLSQEYQGGGNWSLGQKTPANQVKAFIGSLGSGVTSISQGYAIIISPNPLISTGTITADTGTIYSYVRSAGVGTLQSVTNNGNTTTDSIVVKNLEVKGNSYQNGWIGLDSQSSAPVSGIHQVRLFMGSAGNFGFIGSRGYSVFFNNSRLSASVTIGIPNRNITLDSLTTSTQTNGLGKYLLSVSGNLSSESLIPITDINATGTPSSSTVLRGDGTWSAFGTGTVTSIATGYGLTGGTITTSGTIVADTTKLVAFTDTNKVAGVLTRTQLLAYGYTTNAGTVTSVSTSTGLIGGTITSTGTLQIDSTKIPKWDDTLVGNRWFVTPNYLSSLGYLQGQSLTQYYTVVGSGSASPSLIAPSSTVGNLYMSNGSSANPSFMPMRQSYTTTTSSSLTINSSDTRDIVQTITALASNITFNTPTGTTVNGQILLILVIDNGTGGYTFTFSSGFSAGTTVAYPASTTASKEIDFEFMYSTITSKWNFQGFTNGH